MNVHLEAMLRSLGLFLSVYFTVGWGEKSSPKYDIPLMLLSIAFALVIKYYD
jgi:hypothetical protein